MHRASKHTSSLVHTDLKSLPVNDSEPCCQLSNLENQVLYSLGLECSQACQKAWKQKHALYMCMGPHPVRGFWRFFGHWCPFFPPLFLILKSSWLVKKEASSSHSPFDVTLTAISIHSPCKTQTLPHLFHLLYQPGPSFKDMSQTVLSHRSQRHWVCFLVPLLPLTETTTLSSQVLFNTDMYCRTHRKKIKHALLSRSKCLNSGHHKVKHVKGLPLNITQYK